MTTWPPVTCGRPGQGNIWRPFQPIFFKFLRPNTGLAQPLENMPKLRLIFGEMFSRVDAWVYWHHVSLLPLMIMKHLWKIIQFMYNSAQIEPNKNKHLPARSRTHVTRIIVGWLSSLSELVQPPAPGSKPGKKSSGRSASRVVVSKMAAGRKVPLSRRITT